MAPRSLGLSLSLLLATLTAGLLVRFAAFGLPKSLSKYGGSALWALLIYWAVSTLLPSGRIFTLAAFTCVLTATVEFAKLYRTPPLDAFRATLPGILLLGRVFSLWDIAVYWIAIALGAFLDRIFRELRSQPQK